MKKMIFMAFVLLVAAGCSKSEDNGEKAQGYTNAQILAAIKGKNFVIDGDNVYLKFLDEKTDVEYSYPTENGEDFERVLVHNIGFGTMMRDGYSVYNGGIHLDLQKGKYYYQFGWFVPQQITSDKIVGDFVLNDANGRSFQQSGVHQTITLSRVK